MEAPPHPPPPPTHFPFMCLLVLTDLASTSVDTRPGMMSKILSPKLMHTLSIAFDSCASADLKP